MPGKKAFFLFLLAAFLLGACSEKGTPDLPPPPAGLLGDRVKISAGRQLFVAHCAECHGSISEGRTQRAARLNPLPPDFHERRYRTVLPGYLYRRIEWGRKMGPFRSTGSVMPAWGPHLQPQQIWSLVAFIRYRAGTIPLL